MHANLQLVSSKNLPKEKRGHQIWGGLEILENL